MPFEKKDFFISLKSEDSILGDWVVYHLERNGYSYIYQHTDFLPGCDFMVEMNKAMENTKATLAIWTNNYFKSDHAIKEANVALNSSIKNKSNQFIPVKFDDCIIPPLYSTINYIDLAGKENAVAINEFVSRIKAVFAIGKVSTIKKVPKLSDYFDKQENEKPVSTAGFVLKEPLKILYAGAKKSSDLDLENSFKSLEKSLHAYITKGKLKLAKNLNLNTSNIADTLRKQKPHIFHFSGKQDGGDIRLTDINLNSTTISDKELSGLLTSFGGNIKLAVIDTCYSYNCARSIAEVVDFAIGVKDSVYDTDADTFYSEFYKALCSRYSLKDAVGQATASSKFNKVPLKEIPVLFSNKNANASKTFFIQ